MGLETVVILVLLATDSTLIGPWKTGKKGTAQPAPRQAARRPQGLRGCLRELLALLKGQGWSTGRLVPSKRRGSRAQQGHPEAMEGEITRQRSPEDENVGSNPQRHHLHPASSREAQSRLRAHKMQQAELQREEGEKKDTSGGREHGPSQRAGLYSAQSITAATACRSNAKEEPAAGF